MAGLLIPVRQGSITPRKYRVRGRCVAGGAIFFHIFVRVDAWFGVQGVVVNHSSLPQFTLSQTTSRVRSKSSQIQRKALPSHLVVHR